MKNKGIARDRRTIEIADSLRSLRKRARDELAKLVISNDPAMLAWLIRHGIEPVAAAKRLKDMIDRAGEFESIDELIRIEAMKVSANIGVEEAADDISDIEKTVLGRKT